MNRLFILIIVLFILVLYLHFNKTKNEHIRGGLLNAIRNAAVAAPAPVQDSFLNAIRSTGTPTPQTGVLNAIKSTVDNSPSADP